MFGDFGSKRTTLLIVALGGLLVDATVLPRDVVADISVDIVSSSPSQASPRNRWANAHAKAKAFLEKFTLEQKVNVTTGVGLGAGRDGRVSALKTPRKQSPIYRSYERSRFAYRDIPVSPTVSSVFCPNSIPFRRLGVRFADFVTAFPAGINAAATFDRELIRKRGEAMGKEFRGKGVHVALGPAMNFPRAPEGGRMWESFGGDPYLQGEASYETITGIQSQGVQATAKHYLDNDQEHFRETSSSNVDDRRQHEVYLHPFLKSVQAGVNAVMCSYNLVNGTYACENPTLLNDVLKHQLGFQGYIMSDWWATHSTGSASAGLDMNMPGNLGFGLEGTYFGLNLTEAVQNGKVDESRVDDMAERIVAAWFYAGQNEDYPEVNFNAWNPNDTATNQHVDVQDDHYRQVIQIGAASTVLLKNTENTLPLHKPGSIAIIGSDSAPPPRGPNGFSDRGGTDGTLAMGWGSGTVQFPYLISLRGDPFEQPLEAIQSRAEEDDTSVSSWLLDWDTQGAATAAAHEDVAIVFIKSDSGEGYITVDGNAGDRKNLTAWENGDQLVKAVASANSRTIVVVHSVGPLVVEPWIDHPKVTAVVWAGLPGQESGNSLTDILYGDVNPSGRLPYTIGKKASDYAATVVTTGGPNPNDVQIDYTEGLQIDYRWFDAKNIAPRFEFGFGLSYTKFEYSGLEVSALLGPESPHADAWAQGHATSNHAGASLVDWLHAGAYQITFHVKNTGKVDGHEVPQLYLHPPASAKSPPNILRGFDRVHISAGQTAKVTFTLSRYDLSIWDVVKQGWVKPSGEWTFSVGASSRDFRLHGNI
ncbi:hypothetical protein FRB99_003059 [Tulasnella sp. 403]|nr:hypothetical protein FRB99_003059 [Tulasnella sp. 403]